MGRGGGGGLRRCGQVGGQSTIMGCVRLSPCSVVLPVKNKKWKLGAKIQGKVNSEKGRVEVFEGGFPCISVLGYIITSKVNI